MRDILRVDGEDAGIPSALMVNSKLVLSPFNGAVGRKPVVSVVPGSAKLELLSRPKVVDVEVMPGGKVRLIGIVTSGLRPVALVGAVFELEIPKNAIEKDVVDAGATTVTSVEFCTAMLLELVAIAVVDVNSAGRRPCDFVRFPLLNDCDTCEELVLDSVEPASVVLVLSSRTIEGEVH